MIRDHFATRHADSEHLIVQRKVAMKPIMAGVAGVVGIITTIAAIVKCLLEAAP